VKIYIPLLKENRPTECWRPIEAERVGTNTYRVVAFKPEDEEWPVTTDQIVQCELRRFADGTQGLAAILPQE
jgi:hypothetical protein